MSLENFEMEPSRSMGKTINIGENALFIVRCMKLNFKQSYEKIGACHLHCLVGAVFA